MAHLAHYKRSGAAPMLAHYERRAELERGYSRENIDSLRTAQNYAIGADSPQVLAAALRSRVADAIAAHEADSGKAVRRDANVLSDWAGNAMARRTSWAASSTWTRPRRTRTSRWCR